MKKFLLYYGITFLAASAVFVAFAAVNGIFVSETKVEIYAALSNASFFSGGLTLCGGLLVFAGQQGVFDGLSFGFNSLARQFIPGTGLLRRKESYYDFIKSKEAKRKKIKIRHLIIIGAIYVLIAVIFSLIYIQAKG